MSMYTVVFFFSLCLICQTSGRDAVNTGLEDPYILCENQDSPKLVCPPTTIIQIKDAIYGRTVRSVCSTSNHFQSTSCNVTVTSILVSNCSNLQTCLPNALNNIYGDPCHGTYKYLNVTYRCIKDERISSKSSTQLPTLFFTASPSSIPTTEQQELFSTTASPTSSSKTEQQESFSTTDAKPSLKPSTHIPTKLFTALPSSSSNTEQQVSSSTTGLAVGISVSVAVIIVIACVLIILRKRQRSSKKQSTNDNEYIGTQSVAMPRSGDSSEYNDLKVRRESHKYGVLKSVNEATGDSCYDVIDANRHQWKTKVVSLDQGIFQNDSSSIPCQEYAILDPNEKWNSKPNTSPYRDTGCDDYTVLEAEEAITNYPVYPPSVQLEKRPKTHQTKNNEKKMEVKSANNAGFNRMNDTGNDKFDPNTRDMVHDTTHPVKENTNCYELAKPVLEDGKENTCHKDDGDYGSCQDSDYQLNAGHPTYSEEHVYNHTVDDVYDTTSHNKKSTEPNNTYDYFSGNQTDDDYNIPMKM